MGAARLAPACGRLAGLRRTVRCPTLACLWVEARVDGVGEVESVGGDDELLRQLAGQPLPSITWFTRANVAVSRANHWVVSDDDNAPDAEPM